MARESSGAGEALKGLSDATFDMYEGRGGGLLAAVDRAAEARDAALASGATEEACAAAESDGKSRWMESARSRLGIA